MQGSGQHLSRTHIALHMHDQRAKLPANGLVSLTCCFRPPKFLCYLSPVSQAQCPPWLVAVQAPVNGPFVLTTQSLTSFIAQQQQWSSVYRHCATGCVAVGVAIILFKVLLCATDPGLSTDHWLICRDCVSRLPHHDSASSLSTAVTQGACLAAAAPSTQHCAVLWPALSRALSGSCETISHPSATDARARAGGAQAAHIQAAAEGAGRGLCCLLGCSARHGVPHLWPPVCLL